MFSAWISIILENLITYICFNDFLICLKCQWKYLILLLQLYYKYMWKQKDQCIGSDVLVVN